MILTYISILQYVLSYKHMRSNIPLPYILKPEESSAEVLALSCCPIPATMWLHAKSALQDQYPMQITLKSTLLIIACVSIATRLINTHTSRKSQLGEAG